MSLPFTVDQFLHVFADYNRSYWIVAVALWLATAAALVAAWRNPAKRSAMLSVLLGVLWLWAGVAYHALLFTRINLAAWAFSALFVLQSVLLFRSARVGSLLYFSAPSLRLTLGIVLGGYALMYPLLSLAAHEYPATPTFGVPCPTDILTIGLLMTVRGGATMAVSAIPALWGFIGGSAAVLLGVKLDYVLLGAGALLAVTTVTAHGLGKKALLH